MKCGLPLVDTLQEHLPDKQAAPDQFPFLLSVRANAAVIVVLALLCRPQTKNPATILVTGFLAALILSSMTVYADVPSTIPALCCLVTKSTALQSSFSASLRRSMASSVKDISSAT